MNKVPEKSYLNIQAFMINDLNLKGNELIIYALIYGFSQDRESSFKGSLSYMQAWLNAGSKHTVIKAIKGLEAKNLIFKEQQVTNNVKFNRYLVNFEKLGKLRLEKQGSAECAPPSEKIDNIRNAQVVQKMHYPNKNKTNSAESAQEVVQRMQEGSASYAPNNINNNINNNTTEPNKDNIDLNIPTLEDVERYAKTFGSDLFIDYKDFYKLNQERNWIDDKGRPIKNWRALFNVWNNRAKLKFDNQDKVQRRIDMFNTNMDKLRCGEVVVCPQCEEEFMLDPLCFDVSSGFAHCRKCNVSFKIDEITVNRA